MGGMLVVAAVPIRDDAGHVRGALTAAILLSRLQRQIEAIRIGATGYAVLVDASGTVLARGAAEHGEVWRAAVSQLRAHGGAALRLKLNGEDCRVYAAPVTGTTGRWTWCTRTPRSWPTCGAPGGTRWRCCWSAPRSPAASCWARGTSSLPLRRLAESHARVAAGDLTARAEAGSNDEFAALAESFNEMGAALEAANRQMSQDAAVLRTQFERSNIGMALTSPDHRWLRVNRRWTELIGYSEQELLRLTWSELTRPDDLAVDLAQFEAMLAGTLDAYELDKRFVRKDGSVLKGHLTVSCDRAPDGAVRFIIASLQDVTERDRAEQALRESEQRFRSLVEGLAGLVLGTRHRGTLRLPQPASPGSVGLHGGGVDRQDAV